MIKYRKFIDTLTIGHCIFGTVFGILSGFIYFKFNIDIRTLCILIFILWELIEYLGFRNILEESQLNILGDLIFDFIFLQTSYYLIILFFISF